MNNQSEFSKMKKYIIGITSVVLLLFFAFTVTSLFESIDAGEIVVIQAPWSGQLKIITSAGTYWQGYGKVTRYKKSFQYWFTSKKADSNANTEENSAPIKVRFNDGGHADINGSIRVDMPLDERSIVSLHTRYGSQDAIERALIGQSINKAVYMTGPMMSSKESYAERRNDLISYIEDQAINGVYKTIVNNVKVKDPMDTTSERTVAITQIKIDGAGLPMRQEVSPTQQYGIKMYGLSINSVDYDAVVEKQIASQQQAIMQVQTAIANAKRAEQEKFTVEQQGMADAAKAKWEQEVKKAQAVTEAQQEFEVAQLNKKTEEQNKMALILKGEGESSYKKAVTMANNNLELKLDAWVKERQYAWDAFGKFQGQLVPQYQSGGNGSNQNAVNWMEIMGMKAAKDLNLELNQNTSKK